MPEKAAVLYAANVEKYTEGLLKGVINDLLQAASGGRNIALNAAAYNLGQFVAGGAISESVVVERLGKAAANLGLGESETRKTIDSGIRSAANSPRYIRPKDKDAPKAPAAKSGGFPYRKGSSLSHDSRDDLHDYPRGNALDTSGNTVKSGGVTAPISVDLGPETGNQEPECANQDLETPEIEAEKAGIKSGNDQIKALMKQIYGGVKAFREARLSKERTYLIEFEARFADISCFPKIIFVDERVAGFLPRVLDTMIVKPWPEEAYIGFAHYGDTPFDPTNDAFDPQQIGNDGND